MAFDPDDYLSTPPATAAAPAPASGFDPSEYLATQPAQASVFATPSDLADYAKHHSLATGDNGSGAWGDDTTSSIPQVALPRDTITDADHGRPVHLMGANGNVVTAYVTDKMPATYNIKNGASIDLNPAAQAAIGHPGGIAPVRWRFADSPAASGGDAMGGGSTPPAQGMFDDLIPPAPDPQSDPATATKFVPPVSSTVEAAPDERFDSTRVSPKSPAAFLYDQQLNPRYTGKNPFQPQSLSLPLTAENATQSLFPDLPTNLPVAPPSLLERGAGDALAGLDSAGQIIATVPQFVQNTRAQLSDDADEQDRLRASAQEFADQNRLVQQGMSHNGGLDTRIAQGLGTTADAMLPDGVGLATIFAGASNNARETAEEKARAAGASPEDIAAAGDAASNHAALTTAETLPAYMLAGAGAGKVAGALTPDAAGAIRAYLTQAAAGTAGNVAASAGVRALQGEPIAPTAEGFFGADFPFALGHAVGEVGARGKEAMEALRTAAQPGGIDFTADETTDPAPSEPPVAVPPETSQSPGLAPESAESQTRTIPQTEESTLPRTESTTSSVDFTPDPPTGQVASVPFMITRQMEADLRARGLGDDDINKLTPQQANDILSTPANRSNFAPNAGQADISPGDVITTREGVEHTVTGVDDDGNVQAVVPGTSDGDVGREVQLSPEAVRGTQAGGGSVTPAEQVPIAFTPDEQPTVKVGDKLPDFNPGDLGSNAYAFERSKQGVSTADAQKEWSAGSNAMYALDKTLGVGTRVRTKQGPVYEKTTSGWQEVKSDGTLNARSSISSMDLRGAEVTQVGEEPSPPAQPLALDPTPAAQVSPVPPVAPEPEPRAPKGTTATANAVIDEQRAARGLDPITPVARQDFGTAWDKSGEQAAADPLAGKRLVDEINAKPRALNDTENALLLRRQVEAQTVFDRANDAVNNATPEELPAAKAALDQAQSDLYDVHTAARASGAETGRGLNARKMLSSEQYELSSMLNRKRAANDGQPLTEDQTEQTKKDAARIAELGSKVSAHEQMIQELRDQLAKKYPKQTLREAAKAAKPSGKSLTDFLNEKAEAARVRRQGRVGRFNAGVDPTELADLAIIGASHIANGVKRFGEWSAAMVKDAGEAIKPHLLHIFAESKRVHEETLQELDPERKTPREIALKRIGTVLKDQVDVITHCLATGERKPDGTPLEYTPELKKLQQQRDDLNIALRAITKRPDLSLEQRISMATKATERSIKELNRRIGEKDFVPTKRVPVETPELAALRQQRDTLRQTYQEMKDAAGPPKRTPEEIKLANIKSSLTKRTAELQERLKNEDFAKKTRQVTQLDQEALNLKAAHQRAKDAFDMAVERDRLANRPVAQRAADTLVKVERAFKLTGVTTLAKLSGAAMARLAVTPAEETVGSVLSRLPVLRRVAEGAPRYGGMSLAAERAALGREGFLKGVRQIPSILSSGRSDLDVLYGKNNAGHMEGSSPIHDRILDLPGAIHGAIKNPVKYAEFARSTAKRTAFYRRQGLDVDNPLVKGRIATEAYQDAQRAIFMQDNFANTGYRTLVNSLERSTTHPTAGPLAAKGLEWLLPFVKVPTNVIGESLTYGGGLASGAVRLVNAMRKGLDTVAPEQKDLILREFSKGTLGAGLMALGYFGHKYIGGQYQEGDKRDKKDLKPGEMQVFGERLSKNWFHAPAFEVMNFGSTMGRVAEQLDRRTGGLRGIGAGSIAALLGIVKEVPFVREGGAVDKLLSLDGRGDYERGQFVRNAVIPSGVEQAAKYFDQRDRNGNPVKRTPQGVVQSVEAGIPGLRQNVPLATGTAEDRKTNLPLMTPAQRAVYQQAQMQKKLQEARARRMKMALGS